MVVVVVVLVLVLPRRQGVYGVIGEKERNKKETERRRCCGIKMNI